MNAKTKSLLALTLFATNLAYADCKKCAEEHVADMAACEKMGDRNSRATCMKQADDKMNSCLKGFNCK